MCSRTSGVRQSSSALDWERIDEGDGSRTEDRGVPVLTEGANLTTTGVREEGTGLAAPCPRGTGATARMQGTRSGTTRSGLGKTPDGDLDLVSLPKRR
jgi:hypothetical protein